jgi:hypothetical protein
MSNAGQFAKSRRRPREYEAEGKGASLPLQPAIASIADWQSQIGFRGSVLLGRRHLGAFTYTINQHRKGNLLWFSVRCVIPKEGQFVPDRCFAEKFLSYDNAVHAYLFDGFTLIEPKPAHGRDLPWAEGEQPPEVKL